ncbi:MAG: sensor histidine kinase, partial [Actinomycetota bacterium]
MLVDGALAAGLAVFLLVGTYFASEGQPARRPFDAWTVVLLLVVAGALWVRRRYPVAVMGVVFAATLVYFALGYANGPIWLALVISYFTAVAQGHRVAAAVTAVIGFAIFPWLDFLLRDGDAPSPVALAGLAAWLLVVLGAGEIVRIRREHVAEAARTHEEEARRRASEERLRIAR